MLLSKEPYSREAIENILNYLRRYKDKGQPIDFEIIVDKFKAVRRTNDPDDFSMFEDFIKGHTKSIEVLLYTGNSNNNDKYIFTFGDQPQEQGLSGIEIDNKIQDQVSKARQEWEFDRLHEKVKDLEEEVEDLEKEVEKLEKEKEDLLANQSPLKGILGEVGSSFVESFVRRNPQMLNSLPGGTALAGIIEEDNRKQPLSIPTEETEVSFKPKSSGMSEDDKASLTFVNQLKTSFTKEEFDRVLLLLQAMAEDKNRINQLLHHLNIHHEQVQF